RSGVPYLRDGGGGGRRRAGGREDEGGALRAAAAGGGIPRHHRGSVSGRAARLPSKVENRGAPAQARAPGSRAVPRGAPVRVPLEALAAPVRAGRSGGRGERPRGSGTKGDRAGSADARRATAPEAGAREDEGASGASWETSLNGAASGAAGRIWEHVEIDEGA